MCTRNAGLLILGVAVSLLVTLGACEGAGGSRAPGPPATAAPAPPAAAPPSPSPLAATPPAPATVRLADTLAFVSAPLMIAIEKGYFQEQGLEVQIEGMAGAADVIPQLATGELDATHGGISPGMFNAIDRGVEIRVLAPMNIIPYGEGSTQLVIRKELADRGEVRAPPDLRGRRVAVNTSGSLVSWQLDKVLEQHGMTVHDVDRVIIPFPDMPAALANGSIDGAMIIEPFLLRSVQQGIAARLITRTTPGAMTTSLIGSGKWLQERPDVVQRFLIGLMRGIRDLQGPQVGVGHPERMFRPDHIAIFRKYINMPEEFLREQVPNTWDPDLVVPIDTLMEQQAWFQRNGLLTYPQLLPPERVVDERFARAARETLGPTR